MLDGAPKLIPVDEPSNDQIGHRRGRRKTDRPVHPALAPRPPLEVLALPCLGGLLADDVFRCCARPLGGAPALRSISGDAKRLQQPLEVQKNLVLSPSTFLGHDLPRMMLHGMLQPALVHFLAPKGPQLIEC
jgi:hypothetical protein